MLEDKAAAMIARGRYSLNLNQYLPANLDDPGRNALVFFENRGGAKSPL